MEKGKLSKTDVANKSLFLDESVRGLFECYIGKEIKIVDQDECEFLFYVKKGQSKKQLFLSQTKGKKKEKKVDKDKDFFELLGLEEGDRVLFHKRENGSFSVNIEEKEVSSSNTASVDKRNKLINDIKTTYKSVFQGYNSIFNDNHYLPTKEAQPPLLINGFTERNLTFNFCHSYLMEHHNAIVWQEIPIIKVDRQHVDSIIIDKDWVIYIEAKRLYDIAYFKYLLDDFKRIKKHHSNIPLPLTPPTNKAIVLLADHYFHGEGDGKKYKQYYDDFFTGQDNIKPIKLPKNYSNLEKKLPSLIKSTKITVVRDKPLTISIKGEYNISIEEEIVYTIYCGVFFIE